MLVGTPFLWRSRGAVFGLRWLAVSLVPAGLALTGLLTLLGRVASATTSFFTRSVFSPTVWLGYGLIGAALLIWVVARAVRSRGGGRSPQVGARAAATPADATVGPSSTRAVGAAGPPPAGDDEFADIEAILRRRGI